MPGKIRTRKAAPKRESAAKGAPTKTTSKARSKHVPKTRSGAKPRTTTRPRMTRAADNAFRATAARRPGGSTAKKTVTFTLAAPAGWDVAIAGSFNNWEPQAMTRKQEGSWQVTLQLAPGNYHYRFLVDTVWREDPNNPRKVANASGGFDSICDVL
jgi:hypothetical protein